MSDPDFPVSMMARPAATRIAAVTLCIAFLWLAIAWAVSFP
jgi:hypothetical protein